MGPRPATLFSVLLLVAVSNAKEIATTDVSFEAAKRATDQLEAFASRTQLTTKEIQGLFSQGLMDSAPDGSRLRTASQTFLQTSFPHPTCLRVVAQGQVISISPTTLISQETFNLNEQSCNGTLNSSSELVCVHQFGLPSEGSPVPSSYQRSFELSLSAPFANLTATCVLPCWQRIIAESASNNTTAVLSAPAIEFVAQINDTQGRQVGHVGIGLLLPDLQSIIDDVVAVDTDDRIVFVVDDNTKSILAVSTPPGVVASCGQLPISTALCADALIQSFAIQVVESSNQASGQVFVDDDYFAVSLQFQTMGLSWHVVVVRQITITDDMVSFDSVLGISICVLESLNLVFAFFLLGWVVKFRHLQLWHVAQPWMLVLILLSSVGFGVCGFVHLGQNTTASCASREWFMTICMTLVSSALFSKLLRVHLNLNSVLRLENHRRQITNHDMVACVALLLTLQVALLLFWQFTAPSQPTLTYRARYGDVRGYVECASTSSLEFTSVRVVTLVVAFGAIYLSFKTRNVSPMFAESRSLMTTCFHGFILVGVTAFTFSFGDVTYADGVVQGQGAALWFSLTMQMALFFPRVMRQIDQGDLSSAEVKQLMVEHLKHAIRTEQALDEFTHKQIRQPKGTTGFAFFPKHTHPENRENLNFVI